MEQATSSLAAASVVVDQALDARARKSLGASNAAIYRMVADALERHHVRGGTLIDVGCGGGNLWRAVSSRFSRYVGLDAVRYETFPCEGQFRGVDLDREQWPIELSSADVVAAVETIEHLANPWAFMRQLAAIVKPGGAVVVTTPNQLSVLSLLSLVIKQRFVAFQDSHFPTHRTALLESDLCRAARESGLDPLEVGYSRCGRAPLTPWHYPTTLASLWPRALSDNVMIIARKIHA